MTKNGTLYTSYMGKCYNIIVIIIILFVHKKYKQQIKLHTGRWTGITGSTITQGLTAIFKQYVKSTSWTWWC